MTAATHLPATLHVSRIGGRGRDGSGVTRDGVLSDRVWSPSTPLTCWTGRDGLVDRWRSVRGPDYRRRAERPWERKCDRPVAQPAPWSETSPPPRGTSPPRRPNPAPGGRDKHQDRAGYRLHKIIGAPDFCQLRDAGQDGARRWKTSTFIPAVS